MRIGEKSQKDRLGHIAEVLQEDLREELPEDRREFERESEERVRQIREAHQDAEARTIKPRAGA